jgi:hypothetical protein
VAIKSVNAAIGAVGAGTTSARIAMSTPDDADNREVVAIKSSLTTKGMTFTFDINGAPQIVVDAAILSQFTTDLPIDYVVPPSIQIGFTLQNTTGGALAAGDFVTVFYKV